MSQNMKLTPLPWPKSEEQSEVPLMKLLPAFLVVTMSFRPAFSRPGSLKAPCLRSTASPIDSVTEARYGNHMSSFSKAVT
jgi:hypothetical protein